jgi:hypothetical protein
MAAGLDHHLVRSTLAGWPPYSSEISSLFIQGLGGSRCQRTAPYISADNMIIPKLLP